MLYSNTEEVKIELRNLVVLTGIDVVATESDLLDRSLILSLKRVESDKIISEKELWKEFREDLSDILGACFKLLALADSKVVSVPKTRLSDSFDIMIKVGRCLGLKDEQMAEIVWNNRSLANQVSVDDNVAAQCLLLFMEERETYCDSPSNLRMELKEVAEENGFDMIGFPSQPNVLTRQLNAVKINLEQEYGIFLESLRIDGKRKIRIQKRIKK